MQWLSTALWTVIIYGIIGLFGLVVLVLTAIITPFLILKEMVFPSLSPDPAEVDVYYGIEEAFRTRDIDFLEAYATSVPEFPDCEDVFADSWLKVAINTGNPAAVNWVLDRGVEINGYDDCGESPLTCAIDIELEGRDEEIVALLIDRGADVNAKGTLDVTPLHIAAARGSIGVVKLLLERGADPCARDSDYGGERPIDWVNARKRPEIRDMLRAAMNKAEARG